MVGEHFAHTTEDKFRINNMSFLRIYLLLFLIATSLLITIPSLAKTAGSSGGSYSVKGHVKKDGTYVQPHRATNPNNTQRDNWSSKPNVNPNTGRPGNKEAEK